MRDFYHQRQDQPLRRPRIQSLENEVVKVDVEVVAFVAVAVEVFESFAAVVFDSFEVAAVVSVDVAAFSALTVNIVVVSGHFAVSLNVVAAADPTVAVVAACLDAAAVVNVDVDATFAVLLVVHVAASTADMLPKRLMLTTLFRIVEVVVDVDAEGAAVESFIECATAVSQLLVLVFLM